MELESIENIKPQGSIRVKKQWAEDSAMLNNKKKLEQISDIFYEFMKLRDGDSQHQCKIRNMLHSFCGEMELQCIDTSSEQRELSILLEEGVNCSNWEVVDKIILSLYKKIFINS